MQRNIAVTASPSDGSHTTAGPCGAGTKARKCRGCDRYPEAHKIIPKKKPPPKQGRGNNARELEAELGGKLNAARSAAA